MNRFCHRFLPSLATAVGAVGLVASCPAAQENPFTVHGRVQVAESGTHLEHADGTPFFFLADTCWCGPALSTDADWRTYLADRKRKGFTAIQFNMVSPWRAAPVDAEGRVSYSVHGDRLTVNEAFYRDRLDARIKAVNDAGLLAVPVLCWAHKKGDAGVELLEKQLLELVRFEVDRYAEAHVLWILAGDSQYRAKEAEMWKRIGRAVFGGRKNPPVTTHPTGENWPWETWEKEDWLTVLGYQSGHGDGATTLRWIHHGPPAEYGRRQRFTRPVINLEPPYEGHLAYQSRQPHSAYQVRRAVYWSLLVAPVAGVTYGGHGVWSWHGKPGEAPTDHGGSGVAKIWSEALQLPGATEMGHVRGFFESLPWTRLRPAPELLAGQEDDPAKFIACSATRARDTVVVYLPRGARLRLRSETAGPGHAPPCRWFNPRAGVWQTAAPPQPDPDEDWLRVTGPADAANTNS